MPRQTSPLLCALRVARGIEHCLLREQIGGPAEEWHAFARAARIPQPALLCPRALL